MNLTIYQIDAFASELFKGNPAAVCPLDYWVEDELMQNIAAENNLAETAFFVKKNDRFEIRWFTPNVEVDLCGHATLASAYVIFNEILADSSEIIFYSPRSGELIVTKNDELYTLDFPADRIVEVSLSPSIYSGLNIIPQQAYKGKTDVLLIYNNEAEILHLNPNFSQLNTIKARGIIVTAKGNTVDFVSRFFAPQCGVNEDPVTGSAHTTLTPYWANLLNKNYLTAKQLSTRSGELTCHLKGDRVLIAGKCVKYLKGEIYL